MGIFVDFVGSLSTQIEQLSDATETIWRDANTCSTSNFVRVAKRTKTDIHRSWCCSRTSQDKNTLKLKLWIFMIPYSFSKRECNQSSTKHVCYAHKIYFIGCDWSMRNFFRHQWLPTEDDVIPASSRTKRVLSMITVIRTPVNIIFIEKLIYVPLGFSMRFRCHRRHYYCDAPSPPSKYNHSNERATAIIKTKHC